MQASVYEVRLQHAAFSSVGCVQQQLFQKECVPLHTCSWPLPCVRVKKSWRSCALR